MNKILLLTILSILSTAAFAQNREFETAAVRDLVDVCGPLKSKANILTRSLVKTEGRIAKIDNDSLYFKRGRTYFRILHRDILEIECNNRSVSNVADPKTRPYGDWHDINQIFAATKIAVVLTDGTVVKGRSNTATDSHLVIFDPTTNARRDIPKDQVAVLFGLTGGNPGIRTSASKASEGALDVGGDAIIGLAAAGIGAIVGALVKSDGRPVLIYSR